MTVTVVFSDKEKKQFRGFALTRGSDSTRSSMSTPVTLKTEIDSESTRRCMLCYSCLHRPVCQQLTFDSGRGHSVSPMADTSTS